MMMLYSVLLPCVLATHSDQSPLEKLEGMDTGGGGQRLAGGDFGEAYLVRIDHGVNEETATFYEKHWDLNGIFVQKYFNSRPGQRIKEEVDNLRKITSNGSNHVGKLILTSDKGEHGPRRHEFYMLLEYCGEPLSNYILRNKKSQKTISFSRMLDIFRQVAVGLEDMHKLNIIHGDLHSSNICVITKEYKGIKKYPAKIDSDIAKIIDLGKSEQIEDTKEFARMANLDVAKCIETLTNHICELLECEGVNFKDSPSGNESYVHRYKGKDGGEFLFRKFFEIFPEYKQAEDKLKELLLRECDFKNFRETLEDICKCS